LPPTFLWWNMWCTILSGLAELKSHLCSTPGQQKLIWDADMHLRRKISDVISALWKCVGGRPVVNFYGAYLRLDFFTRTFLSRLRNPVLATKWSHCAFYHKLSTSATLPFLALTVNWNVHWLCVRTIHEPNFNEVDNFYAQKGACERIYVIFPRLPILKSNLFYCSAVNRFNVKYECPLKTFYLEWWYLINIWW